MLLKRITAVGVAAADHIRETLPATYEELMEQVTTVDHVTQLTYWSVLSLESALKELGYRPNVWTCFRDIKR